MPVTFSHLINPVLKPPGHELAIAQPITFASLQRARDDYRAASGHTVQLICAVYPEDEPLIPEEADKVVHLQESFRDITGSPTAPKLPAVREMLTQALEVATSDYIIYSNIDIALMPFFYSAVSAHLERGYDNLIVNRRSIFPAPDEMNSLTTLYALAGQPHPGYDCFVFRASDARKFDLGNMVAGLPGFDWVMALNLWYRAGVNLGLYDHHLTFHIGDDKTWTSDAMRHWQELNYAQIRSPLASLQREFGDKPHFVWPRPVKQRSLPHKIMNRLGRELLGRWPNQN